MPRVISVNNHRFPGPNQYYAGPTSLEAGGLQISGWVSPSPGILITPFPKDESVNDPSLMYRYNLITNSVQTITLPAGAPRPNYSYVGGERPGYASLGGGFAQSIRRKSQDGVVTITNWIWNDSTLTWSLGASLTGSSIASALYELSPNRTILMSGSGAHIYNRITNTWTAVATNAPRNHWAGAKISDNLVYFAGVENEVFGTGGTESYTASSAPSFIFNGSNNTWIDLSHSIELQIPKIGSFGGTTGIVTRCGLMQQFGTAGVIGIGKNNDWVIYRHDLGIVYSRPRSQNLVDITLLRPNPTAYVLNTESNTGYVYSY